MLIAYFEQKRKFEHPKGEQHEKNNCNNVGYS